MPNLTDAACKTTKPLANGDVLLGDGNGLYLRIRPGGTRVWVVDYLVRGTRRKINIGNYDPKGGKSENVDGLLDGGRLSLAQARFVADRWKELRRGGCDPAADREATKATAEAAQAVLAAQPTIREVVARFMAQHIDGKKSAAAVHYRLGRLAELIGEFKIRDATRRDVIAALEKISAGQKKGRTAKQLAGEILTTAKRLWRFAESREWVAEKLHRTADPRRL